MKTYFVKDLKSGQELIDFFLVRSANIKMGSTGKKYLDITLGDKTGELTGKKWDVSPTEEPALEAIEAGDVVKVKAEITTFRDARQFRVTKIRKSTPEDMVDMRNFVKSAPEAASDMYEYLYEQARGLGDDDMRKLSTHLLEINKEKLLYYPAATRNHHAEMAGLMYHMKRMVMHAIVLCQVYPSLNRDLLICGVIIHDIEKMTEIKSNQYGVSDGYSMEGNMLGHLVQGVKVIDRLCRELGILEEKSIMLQHMCISHHYEPEFGSPKKPLFPEAEMLHYLDIVDARMYDIEEALSGVKPGEFSERVYTLDNRRLYKPTFEK